jgi:hypothetical protein
MTEPPEITPHFSTLDTESFRVLVAVQLRNGDTSVKREQRTPQHYLTLADQYIRGSYAMPHPLTGEP